MPRKITQEGFNKKLYRRNDDLQNRSFLSEKNVICQERKLRGRILKPIELHRNKRASSNPDENRPTSHSSVVDQKQFEVLDTKLSSVINESSITILVPDSNVLSQNVLLYKTIDRLWHENLQMFIYHSDSEDFSNFIQPFPDLVAVQIKVILPASTQSELDQILSAKNFIFHKSMFLKMIDSSHDNLSTRNIIFVLHSSNKESKTIRVTRKRPASDIMPTKTVSTEMDVDEPLDLSAKFTQTKPASKILNRNIINKLQRLNTVIRRLPERTTTTVNNMNTPNLYVTYRNSKLPSMVKFNYKTITSAEPRFKLVPVKYLNYNGKFAQYIGSYKNTVIKSLPPFSHSYVKPEICYSSMKTDMWMRYTSATELFDREVSLAELDAIPNELIFKAGPNFNIANYL